MKVPKLSRTIRIPLIYGIFSILWIVITDHLAYFEASSLASATTIAIAKGTLFVLLSTLLIYLLLKADERQQASLQTEVDLLQESFSFLFDDNPQPMWIDDPESLQLMAVNAAALQAFGYTREEFLSRCVNDLCVPEEYPLLHRTLVNRLEGLRRTGPWRLVGSDGKIFFAYVVSVNIDFSGHKSNLNTVIDISEQKQIEETLKQTTLERDDFEAFSFSVSHDLRAPLRAIDGYRQILLEEYGALLDARGRDYLEKLRLATHSMNQTIEDLLILSGITHRELKFEFVDLSQVARQIIDQLRNEDPQREVTFICIPEAPARADVGLIYITLYNLLENAWKYSSKKPAARIEFGCMINPANERVFFVKDNGAGFDASHAGQMFKPFERFHPATEFSGNGIGLSVVARIIERHKGKIWAEGTVGEGATFYFTLGMDDEPMPSTEPAD